MGIFDDATNFLSGLLVRAEASHILIKGTDAESEQKIHEIQLKLLEQEFEASSSSTASASSFSDDHTNTNASANANAHTLTTVFAKAAALYSECPSGRSRGGSLGEFGRYSMVPEFDQVVFNKENAVGVVHGPIRTSFGYHLILIASRSDTTTTATTTTTKPPANTDVTTTTTTPDEK